MANQLRKSNRKRTIKSQREPVAKRQKRAEQGAATESKSAEYEESIDDEAATSPITNLCNELLDRILGFLDLPSLVSVADTCKRLRVSAVTKFSQDSGYKRVILRQGLEQETIKIDSGRTLKLYLGILRCFGDKISHLCIQNSNKIANKGDDHLDRYIHQYCADTLTKLELEYRVISMNAFSQPMKNITKLRIFNCDLGKQLPNFVDWFPNLRDLELHMDSKNIDENLTAVSFPHLESLSFGLSKTSGRFNSNCATKLLQANPQLKHLYVVLHYKKSFGQLLKLLSKNSSLVNLKVYGNVKEKNSEAVSRHLKKFPLLEALDLGGYIISVEDAVLLSRKLALLKSFSFRLDNSLQCEDLLPQLDDHWQHSISQVNTRCTQIVLSH